MKKVICILYIFIISLFSLYPDQTSDIIKLYEHNPALRKKRIVELKDEIKDLNKRLKNFSYLQTTDLDKDTQKNIFNELKREKKETRKELRAQRKKNLEKIDSLMDAAITNEEYESLLKHRKELRKEYLVERKNYRQESYVEEKTEDSINEFKRIIMNLDKDSLTFVTNGTRISKQGPESQYFFSTDKLANSYKYTEEFGSIFNSKESIFLSWVGKNNDKARKAAANNFTNRIKSMCFSKSLRTGKKLKDIPINLIGHSHGGNIMILVSNQLLREEYNVQLLFTLNTPRREYIPLYPVEHVQLFSYDDKVQKIGAWDFDFLWQDMDYQGPAARKFENAVNINLNYFLDYDTFKFFSNEFLGLYKTGRDYYHQITRYLGIIEKIILDESKIDNLRSTVGKENN
ncbi:MAG: hypothetical protein A2015_07310 [Spirochaetes bacterium GWF1_31_7]|nr:MAG: hypothetical protein A2Y30_02685 [Spirochaetes bacterium GWE1_32_154]OHD50928.1 MAG: hypothetical protein A2Y29_02765 [Spirochaetes bacterium GWE2_31_10]OHD51225.1 MAG: hypothetical protein A2015_07310 [Spirochaetes bacterium GWF1_31_7]HBD92543.1 hypothetical protein [Spirochaetia bacterium]HBI37419.1 hypothetical protein [Spirochaetia bacterium]